MSYLRRIFCLLLSASQAKQSLKTARLAVYKSPLLEENNDVIDVMASLWMFKGLIPNYIFYVEFNENLSLWFRTTNELKHKIQS